VIEDEQRLQEYPVEYLISVYYPNILEPELLAHPERGALNLHQAELPRYRRSNVFSHAIMNARPDDHWRQGTTLHFMAEDVDAGDIVDKRFVPITEEDTARTLAERTEGPSIELFEEALPAIVSGAIDDMGTPQAEFDGERYFYAKDSLDDLKAIPIDALTDSDPDNEENHGISASFNRAASEAHGELLCILGDDDHWHPEKVRKQVALIHSLSSEYGVVYTGGVMTDGDLVTKRYRPQRRGDIYPEVLVEFELHPHSGHMIRRGAFEAVGGFDPELARGVDWDLAIRLAKRYEFECVPEALVRRVYHGSNVPDEPAQVTVRDRIAEKYAEDLARHPTVRRRFESQRRRTRVRWELRYGNRDAAISHALSGLRTAPSTTAAVHLLLALSGQPGYRVAGHTRRRFVDALAALGPSEEATAAW
jgi:hypothetical protein